MTAPTLLAVPSLSGAFRVGAEIADLLAAADPTLYLTASVRPFDEVAFLAHNASLDAVADAMAVAGIDTPTYDPPHMDHPYGWVGGSVTRDGVRIVVRAQVADDDLDAARDRFPAGSAGF